MTDWRDTGERVTKLVALAGSPNEHEAARARDKALHTIAAIDLELLETLAGQRDTLLSDMHAELHRLMYGGARHGAARANAGTVRLVERAQLLLGHYRKLDALPAIVTLIRNLNQPKGN